MFMTLTNVNHNNDELKNACDEIKKSGDAEYLKHYEYLITNKKVDASLSPMYYAKKYGADLNAIVQLGL